MNRLKLTYSPPSIVAEEIMVEAGIAASPLNPYEGDPGAAGGKISIFDENESNLDW